MDAGNAQFGETLTMAISPPIVLAPLFLKNDDRPSSALVDDFSLDFGPLTNGCPTTRPLSPWTSRTWLSSTVPPTSPEGTFHLDE